MPVSIDVPDDLLVLWALLTVREGRYSDFREMLAEIKLVSTNLYDQHLQGLKWKTRFMK